MSYFNKFNKSQITLNMKKSLFTTLLMLMVSFSFISCNKDNGITGNKYYVRYEVGVNTSHIPTTHITVNTDSGIQNFEAVKTFEEIFGPVNKDFCAEIDVNVEWGGNSKTTVSIYVSKNDGPFALKAYKSVNSSKINLSYQIDF